MKDTSEAKSSAPTWRERPASAALIGVCTVLFVALEVVVIARADQPGRALLESLWKVEDIDALRGFGALESARVWIDGEWWRAATAGLLHGSWLHLGLNMMGLWVVGQWIEKAWGSARMLGVFAASSVIGCLASLAWAEAPMVVGASAGIFGLAGALWVGRAFGDEPTQQAVAPVSAKVLGRWLVFWLVLGFALPWLADVQLLAQAGHVGGLLAGVGLGWALGRSSKRRSLEVAGWVGAVLVLAGVAMAAARPSWRENYEVFMGFARLDRGEFEGASRHFEAALSRDPEDPELANAVAYAYAEAGVELERAELLVRGALEVEPERGDFMDTLGWVQCKLGETEAGLESLREAERLSEGEIEEVGEHIERCAEVGVGAR